MAFQLFFLHLMFICPPRLQKTLFYTLEQASLRIPKKVSVFPKKYQFDELQKGKTKRFARKQKKI